MKPRALDLYCKAGGVTRGLQRAGYYVVGVDREPQPNYIGDEFYQADALTYPLEGFDFLWASPPCQGYSWSAQRWEHHRTKTPKSIGDVRRRFADAGVPHVIENVVGAPLRYPLRLCGLMFGLKVIRWRLFETSHLLLMPDCPPKRGSVNARDYCTVAGHGGNGSGKLADWREAMGIDWMSKPELAEAIPPAYAQYIGEQMLPHVLRAMKARAVA